MIWLTEEPIDTAAVIAAASGPDAGGTVVFIGTVRDQTAGRPVVCLEYEAYAPMAHRKMAEIAAAATERWGARVAVAHRVGRLAVGEASVVIAAAAAHRAEAFAACRYVLDTLKEEVPIWKKEHGPDGAVWV